MSNQLLTITTYLGRKTLFCSLGNYNISIIIIIISTKYHSPNC